MRMKIRLHKFGVNSQTIVLYMNLFEGKYDLGNVLITQGHRPNSGHSDLASKLRTANPLHSLHNDHFTIGQDTWKNRLFHVSTLTV